MVEKIDAWQCKKCGRAFLHKHAAEKCCEELLCKCGNAVEKGRTMCHDCLLVHDWNRAEKIPYVEYTGEMIYCAEIDQYFSDIDELKDALENKNVKFIHPCDKVFPEINFQRLVEDVFEDIHEDICLNGLEELEVAIKKFNEAHTNPTFYPDKNKILTFEENNNE